MNIIIKTLSLKNFRGIKSLNIKFKEDENFIRGDNATGKTTISDGIMWLLFDKNSADKKTFEIKTLDSNNNTIPGLEHSVVAEIQINGKSKTFQKIFKEKWQKKRGEAESTFTGHETLYYVNDVPLTMAEYRAEISAIIDESLFKLVTNPLYFSQGLKWQERREILMQMQGGFTIEKVIATDKELTPLMNLLNGEEDIDRFRKSLAAKKKKLNDDIKLIPARIDECNNSIVTLDVQELKRILVQKETRFNEIELKLASQNNLETERGAKLNRVQFLQLKLEKFEKDKRDFESAEKDLAERTIREFDSKISNKQYQISENQRQLANNSETLARLKDEKKEFEKEAEKLRADWHKENDTKLHIDSDFLCPLCKRTLPEEDIKRKTTELQENFNLNKANKLSSITKRGSVLKNTIDSKEQAIFNINEAIECLNKERTQLLTELETLDKEKALFLSNPTNNIQREYTYPDEYFTVKAEKEKLDEELSKPSAIAAQLMELATEKRELQKTIDSVKAELNQEANNEKLYARIQELQNNEKELAQQIALFERQEFLCERFIKAKVELLEADINSKFSYVTFKLFSKNINGGIEECCEPMVKGVPFTDVNNAGRINAGIDIINTLSNHYGVSAPIIIDNREAVNEIIKPVGQVINLSVSKDKQLQIN